MNTRFDRGDFIDDRYLVLNVRQGGMSLVYLTVDLNPLEMQCRAIKSLAFAEQWSSSMQAALRTEAAAWVSLGSHPNVVPCYFLFDLFGCPHLVLEWVSDENGHTKSVRDALRHQLLSPHDALRVTRDVCEALRYCNERLGGVVHGDIKPENVLLGENNEARLTDFGLARTRFAQEAAQGSLEIRGTPQYMAPELWAGQPSTASTDIYAIGCMLYELIEGRPPFSARTMSEWRQAHMADIPEPPRRMSDALWGLTRECLAKHAANRLDSVERLAAALDALDSRSTTTGATTTGATTTGARTPAAKSDEEAATVWGNRAMSLQIAKRYDEALAAFEKTLALDPTLSRAYNNRALLYCELERFEDAFRDWDTALALDPDFVEVYNNRANYRQQRGDLDGALKDARRAVELAPSWINGLGTLAMVLIERDELPEALEMTARAMAIAPENVKVRLQRLEALMAAEQWREAYACAKELLARESDVHPALRLSLIVDVHLCEAEMGHVVEVVKAFDGIAQADGYAATLLATCLLRRHRPLTAMVYAGLAHRAQHEGVEELMERVMRALIETPRRTRRDAIGRYFDFQVRWEKHADLLRQLAQQWSSRPSAEPLSYERFLQVLLDFQDPQVLWPDKDSLLRNLDFLRWLEQVAMPALLPGDKEYWLQLAAFQAMAERAETLSEQPPQ